MQRGSPHAAATAALRQALRALTRPLDGVFADLARADRLSELAAMDLPLADVDPFTNLATAEAPPAGASEPPTRSRGGRAPTTGGSPDGRERGRRAPLPATGAAGDAQVRARHPAAPALPNRKVQAGIDRQAAPNLPAAAGQAAETGSGGGAMSGRPGVNKSAGGDRTAALNDALRRAFVDTDERRKSPSPAAASRRSAAPAVAPAPQLASHDLPTAGPGPMHGAPQLTARQPAIPGAAPEAVPESARGGTNETRPGAVVAATSFDREERAQAPANGGIAGAAEALAHYSEQLFQRRSQPSKADAAMAATPHPLVPGTTATADSGAAARAEPLIAGRHRLAASWVRPDLPHERERGTYPATGQPTDPHRRLSGVPSESSLESWQEGRRLADLINEVLAEQARLDGVDLS